jgi:uncharacterized protein (DUF433 family)
MVEEITIAGKRTLTNKSPGRTRQSKALSRGPKEEVEYRLGERTGGFMTITEDHLIAQHITDIPTADPHKRNEPVITRTGTPVWAVVGYCLRACKGSLEMAAKDYGLTKEEVQAALAYYRHHQEMDVQKEEEISGGAEAVSLP